MILSCAKLTGKRGGIKLEYFTDLFYIRKNVMEINIY